uniref:F-box protein 22 n=1 Tax=Amphilophus citrinellus TaxID=61819 RepID=A0A3Q0T191_AMPCI
SLRLKAGGDCTISPVAPYILSNVAEVVERILTFIPTKSLLRLASVCRLWRNCARRVLRTQQQLTWVSASGQSGTKAHALNSILAEEVEYYTCVSFLTDMFILNYTEAKKSRSSPDAELNQLFPKGCDIMGIATPGIVLTPSGSCSNPPQEYQEGGAGFAIMFPAVEGVQIQPFHFCKKTISPTLFSNLNFHKIFNSLVLHFDNPELRVVLIFFCEAYKPGGARFLNQILEPLAKSKALIGTYGVMGLALSGPKVQGASVLLEQDVISGKAAEATIRRLKAAKIPEKNTLGFMFACVGRGQNYYSNQSNVEADAFHKVFPNTPLFGLFGNGEIGCDRIIKDDYTLCDTDTDRLQHEYTTVMTLVHLG